MRKILVASVALTLAGPGIAVAAIIPFKQVAGVRLGMTMPQAKRALGSCPTLTRRTARKRSRYRCYFNVSRSGTDQELTYGNLVKHCGADITFRNGRVVGAEANCKGNALPNGVGIGATFKRMYSSFPRGTVRCGFLVENGGNTCIAQRRVGGSIFLTKFNDDETRRDRIVEYVTVEKCLHIDHNRSPGKPAFMPCAPDFLSGTQARVPGEFTP